MQSVCLRAYPEALRATQCYHCFPRWRGAAQRCAADPAASVADDRYASCHARLDPDYLRDRYSCNDINSHRRRLPWSDPRLRTCRWPHRNTGHYCHYPADTARFPDPSSIAFCRQQGCASIQHLASCIWQGAESLRFANCCLRGNSAGRSAESAGGIGFRMSFQPWQPCSTVHLSTVLLTGRPPFFPSPGAPGLYFQLSTAQLFY